MERILIIGCGGSGKSTLARHLGDKLGLPVIHLDQLWWLPGWVERDRESFDLLLAEELSRSQWIIDGNYLRTMPQRLKYCDTVIYLDYSRFTCLLGVLKRVIKTHGTTRPDMGPGCPERFDFSFVKWVWNFNRDNRNIIMDTLSQYPDVTVHIFKNRRSLTRFLKNQ